MRRKFLKRIRDADRALPTAWMGPLPIQFNQVGGCLLIVGKDNNNKRRKYLNISTRGMFKESKENTDAKTTAYTYHH